MRPPPLAGASPEGWRRLRTRLTEGEKRGGALTTCNLRVSQSVSVAIYISKPELRLGDLKNAKIFGACGGQEKKGGSGKKKKRPGELKTLPLH